MLHNKIIVSGGKINEEREERPGSHGIDRSRIAVIGAAPDTKPAGAAGQDAAQPDMPPLDENVWGNDYTLLNKMSEKQLADRRLFVRVRYIQKIECHTVLDSMKSEPYILARPLVFVINELSVAGIGVICDHAINVGKILAFRITIDNIPYDIQCEVVYCIPNDDKFRACLKLAQRDKRFFRHMKIFIARTSLNLTYGMQEPARLPNQRIQSQSRALCL